MSVQVVLVLIATWVAAALLVAFTVYWILDSVGVIGWAREKLVWRRTVRELRRRD